MDDLTELEIELKKLRPRSPTAGLARRIEDALTDGKLALPTAGVSPKRRNFRVNWFGIGLGLAAATAFLVLARVNVDRAGTKSNLAAISPIPSLVRTPTTDKFVPVGLTQVVYNTTDEGLLFPAGASEPVRRLRSQKRETLQWRNPKTGTSLRVSYPSEEVTLIPVSGQ
jgi:hypothetical protein